MAAESNYSEPDKKLLRNIDEANRTGIAITGNDPITPLLVQYRKNEKISFASATLRKEIVWQKIEQAVITGRKNGILHFISNSTTVQKWAAAAVVVIALVIGLFYNQTLQEPLLLGEATARIESINLADGTSVSLRPNSKLYAVSEKTNKVILRLEGEAFFDVTRNEHRIFSVNTDEGTVSVLGTRFNVSSRKNELRVYLEEGSVKVEPKSKKNGIILKPGESASVRKNGIPIYRDYEADEIIGWLHQSLIFRNRAVTDIISELEQHYNITIEVPAELLQQRLTGELSLENTDTTFADLGLVLGGTFTRVSGTLFKFTDNQ